MNMFLRFPRIVTLASALLAFGGAFAADYGGDWSGEINLRGLEIRLIFNLQKDASGNYSGRFSSPEQGIRDMPISYINSHDDGTFKMRVQDASAEFSGKISAEGTLKGNFSQGGTDFPTDLKKSSAPKGIDKSICGLWKGNMHVGGKFMEAVLEISDKNGEYFADFSVPQTSPNAMPVFYMEKSGKDLSFAMPYMKASFKGKISPDGTALEGFLEQFGVKNQIKLKRQPAR